MDCETAKDLLGPYYDDELDPAERDLVARHVENCSSCARELESLAKLDRDSRLLFAPEPPLDIWDSVESRLATRETKRTRRWEGVQQASTDGGDRRRSRLCGGRVRGINDRSPRPKAGCSGAGPPGATHLDRAERTPGRYGGHVSGRPPSDPTAEILAPTTNATNRWESAASRSRLCCRTRPYYLSAVTNVSFGCESIRRKPSRKPSRLNTASCGNFTTVPARSVPNAKRRPCHNRPTRLTVPRGD